MSFSTLECEAAFWNKKKKKSETKTETKYETLTKDSINASKGLFNVYKEKGDFYFEIPSSLLKRDMLVVNKLTRVPLELNEAGVNRGTNYENQMIWFEMSADKKNLNIRQIRPLPLSPADDAITRSIKDNYISPLITSFKIEAFNSDSTTIVVKVNDVFNGEDTSINNVFNSINLGTAAKKNLSTIKSIKAFNDNVVAISELTTKVTEGNSSVNITLEVSSSIVLLPTTPMRGRLDSPRIGYFTTDMLYYSDSQQRVDERNFITRWRLEPSDKAAYIKGELVEPVKPIVFYLDGSTPKKWRKYLKEGIEEWQAAFEKIGYKNAIIAKELTDSMAVDADDVNYSQIMYAASTKSNAMGPSLLDPRSGEILEADIMWWHNVISMLQQWITVQTGAINPDVRKPELPDSIIGDAIRFVVCHEVGHSLGLRHNMMGSWAITTDQLRSKEFTDRLNSTSSSIMDYARYNYVAQPGDGVTKVAPHVGPYDYLAIEYGYRWYGNVEPEDEKENLHALLSEHKGNLYKYSEAQDPRDAVDPRAQNEDLGNDPVKSSKYGIANLKFEMPHIIEWTTTGEKGQTYKDASRLYYSVVNQWNNYLYHVMANVGGIYIENTEVGDGEKTYTYVEKAKQKESVKFLIDELFTFPAWLFDTNITNYTYLRKYTPLGMVEVAPTYVYKNCVAYVVYDLLTNYRLMRMLENELVNGKEAYTAVELLNDLHKQFFATTESGRIPDVMTRNLQKAFIDALITSAASSEGIKINKKLVEDRFFDSSHSFCNHDNCDRMGARRELSFYGSQINRTSDAISVKRGELLRIKDLMKRSLSVADTATKYHYKDIIIRIDNALGINN
ncbi:MAG: zinc-dependent metalloprotease [Muribaculaceae bacterium]|nr:zinc-dependent metalloprotease [Muribaculaceae bacterium]